MYECKLLFSYLKEVGGCFSTTSPTFHDNFHKNCSWLTGELVFPKSSINRKKTNEKVKKKLENMVKNWKFY